MNNIYLPEWQWIHLIEFYLHFFHKQYELLPSGVNRIIPDSDLTL